MLEICLLHCGFGGQWLVALLDSFSKFEVSDVYLYLNGCLPFTNPCYEI